MFGRVLNRILTSTPQCKCNIKFSNGRSEHCKREQKKYEFDKKNARTWVRILSLYIPDKELKQQPATLS